MRKDDPVFQLIVEKEETNPINLPVGLAIFIGRGDTCDVQLQDPSASRVHCRVVVIDGRVKLYDAGSRWGTFVNEQRISECDLRPGDRIRIGETSLILTAQPGVNHTTLARRSELLRPEGVDASLASIAVNSISSERMRGSEEVIEAESDSFERFATAAAPPVPFGREQVALQDFIGTTFHRYNVQRLIAQSANGSVFLANSVSDNSQVALKVFKLSYFKSDTDEQRFTRAVRTMFEKRHPNIVELLNAGRWNGWSFTASEYIEGISAQELIRQIGIVGMLPPEKVLRIAIDLSNALQFAESNDIIHRNIRPSNILIRKSDGVALLNDLTLVRAVSTMGSDQMTAAGDILSDASYMSPEQLGSGYPLDHRSDIYQLGASLYALLTGRPPAEGGTIAATITQVLTTIPESPRSKNMSISMPLEFVIMKMLAKNPRDRYQSARELAAALDKVATETDQHRVRCVDADPRATGWKGALDNMF